MGVADNKDPLIIALRRILHDSSLELLHEKLHRVDTHIIGDVPTLPDDVRDLLSHGLKCCIPQRINKDRLISDVGIYFRRLRIAYMFGGQSSDESPIPKRFYVPSTNPIDLKDTDSLKIPLEIKEAEVNKALEDLWDTNVEKPFHRTITRPQQKALEYLKDLVFTKRKIVVKPTDKNLGPAVMDIDWYRNECLRQLSDETTYTPKETGVSIQRVGRFNRIQTLRLSQLYKRLFKDNHIIHLELKWIYRYILHKNDGEKDIPFFYILPKVHKKTVVGRPIAAGHSWLTTPWSAILCYWLQPVLDSMPTVLKDSSTLVRILDRKQFNQQAQHTLVTADVVSLYPSLTIRQVIANTMNCVWNHYRSTWPVGMFRFLRQTLVYVLSHAYVQFEESTYLQTKGLAMGTPSAPMLANITLALSEKSWLARNPRVKYYTRYIDDVFFVVTASAAQAEIMVTDLYTELGLKITTEMSASSVEYLDLVIHKDTRWLRKGLLDLSTHQKAMNKYIYLPYRSAHPTHSKKGFITGELLRYVMTCTSEIAYRRIRKAFYLRLRNRGYPHTFLLSAFKTVSYHNRYKRLNNESTDHNELPTVFSTEYHPIWGKPEIQHRMTTILADMPGQLHSTVSMHKRPLIAFKKTRSISSHLVKAKTSVYMLNQN